MPETIENKKHEAGVPANNNNIYGLSEDISRKLLDAIEENDTAKVKELFAGLHPADIADFIDSITTEQRTAVITIIKDSFDPEILVELDDSVREEILDLLGTGHSAKAINTLDTDDAVDIIEKLEEEDRQEILDAMPEKNREKLEEGLSYPEDSAGRLVEENIVSVPQFWNVGQTIDYLRASHNLPEDFYQVFIVDPKLVPVGGVMLSKILCSSREIMMKDIMYNDIKVIRSDMDQEEVAFIFRQYGLVSAPVVNETGRMIGVIGVDDIVDVIEEEAQEDILRLGGVSGTDVHAGSFATLRRRFPWLLLNLVTAIIASRVVGLFEGSIAKIATLAVLMPITASMAGNSGTQSLTVMVRALATKEISSNNVLRTIRKEILVGIMNGLLLATITGTLIYLWYGDVNLSFIFGMAMIATLFISGLFGAMVPICLEKIGVDPAIASGIMLTAITDMTAFATFLGFATLILL